ncbi:MAG: sigma-70 family RNA polymerase sigma factor [Candidatus Zixiibacteriota bacterium]|nr:MAG: sigma-70 family RNA polymerase sigma factor [candidate division Zixibacteria bacterium]
MPSGRLIYQNWIAERGPLPHPGDWTLLWLEPDTTTVEELDGLREMVAQAVESLDEQERFLIFRYYYLGESLSQMSLLSGRARYRLAAMHQRALRKLKRSLAGLVKARYGLTVQSYRTCPVCESSNREEIEAVLRSRDWQRSWRPVMELLRKRYGVIISTPQVLIGHEKYHWPMDENLRGEK